MDIPRRSKGPVGGFRLQAQDRAGLLTLDMCINPATSTYNAQLSYQFNDQVLPKDAVPVLALCNALVGGEQMAIATLDGQILALGSGPFSHLNWPDGDGYLRCARQLAEIQERAGAFFPLPIAFEPEDQYWMDYASKLLRGEDVQISWPGSTAPQPFLVLPQPAARLYPGCCRCPSPAAGCGHPGPDGGVVRSRRSSRTCGSRRCCRGRGPPPRPGAPAQDFDDVGGPVLHAAGAEFLHGAARRMTCWQHCSMPAIRDRRCW